MPRFFAGLDWASRAHAICVVDELGRIAERFEVTHDAAGLKEAARRLQRFASEGPVGVAIERPSGLIVDALVEAGHPVFPIHPNAVKAMRPRYRSHGAKTDASDAYLLADALRTDGHRFRQLTPQSDGIRALRALVRGRDDLVATRVEVANQLRSLLESFWPGALAIFADIDSPIALAFVQRYPTPLAAHRLGEKRLASFLAQHSYCGRRPTSELLQRLREAAPGRRFPTDAQLAAEAGVAPVTYESGKSRTVAFRWACNHRLRRALTCLADNSRHASTWAATVYRKARDRGCDHPHAIRILTRAWLRVLWRAWVDRKPYDPQLHKRALTMG